MPSVEPIPASWSRRRLGLAKTAPNDRSDSTAPRRIPTVSRIAAFVANWKSEWEDSRPVVRLEGDSAEGRAKNFHTGGNEMSEDEARRIGVNEEEGDEVEAHRSGAAASDEGATEGDDD